MTMNLEHELIACANDDGAEIRISPDEFQIRTSGMLSTQTLRAALAIGGKDLDGGCTLTHKARYTVLKVKCGVTDGADNGNEEVGA